MRVAAALAGHAAAGAAPPHANCAKSPEAAAGWFMFNGSPPAKAMVYFPPPLATTFVTSPTAVAELPPTMLWTMTRSPGVKPTAGALTACGANKGGVRMQDVGSGLGNCTITATVVMVCTV